jgi:hypothetical protein
MSINNFNQLHKDVAINILSCPFMEDGTLNYRLVCKNWKEIFDQGVLKKFLLEMQQRINQIPKALGLRSIVVTFIDQANLRNVNIFQFGIKELKNLIQQLKRAIGPIKTGLITNPEKIKELSEKDTNLHILWDAIKDKVNPQPTTSPQTAEQIFNWMEANPQALDSLTSLNLDNLGLTALPPEIGMLTQLQHLYLNNNKITKLPTEIKNCSQLRCLGLQKNQITYLPKEIEELTQLEELYLNNNKIRQLPKEILTLANLTALFLHCNPILAIDKEILSSTNPVFALNQTIQQFKRICQKKVEESIS